MTIISRPGIWKRAGMDGTVVGLEWPAALAMLEAAGSHNRHLAGELLASAESSLCEAVQAKAATEA